MRIAVLGTGMVGKAISLPAARSIFFLTLWSLANAQSAPGTNSPTLIQQMAGTWNVGQRMWPGPGAAAVELPPALARRRVMQGGFLEEVMEPAEKSPTESFLRIAYFNFNAVNQQYEYFSLDSRAPQMMNEKSNRVEESKPGEIKLSGGSFVAPRWGEATNMAFAYRLTVGAVTNNRQVVQLYLTPQAGESRKEFLAFEYVYTRRQ